MRAGIYQRRDTKKLIYVAKDRSVRAYEQLDGIFLLHPLEWQVSSQQKEQVVSWPVDLDDSSKGVEFADRVADAPNGCTDHAQALYDYRPEQRRVQTILPTLRGDNRQMLTYAQGVVENHLAGHAPAVQTEQPSSDLTNPEPATPDFAERAQEQLDIVNDYERAKKDLQFMLYAEQTGIVRWEDGDWTILDARAWDELNADPPKLLPVLPEGFVASRAAAYVANKKVGMMPKAHGGGVYTGRSPGEAPTILTRGEERHLAKPLALGERYDAGAKTMTVRVCGTGDAYSELAKDLVGKYRKAHAGFRPSELLKLDYCPQTESSSVKHGEVPDLPPGVQPATPSLAYTVTGRPMPRSMKRHGATGAVAYLASEKEILHRIQAGELRLIGKQSKRKHRRAGHRVFWCAPLASWVWEVQA